MLTLLWFKRDLRVIDHAALHAAASHGAVLPLYIIEPDYWQQADTSSRQWQFVKQALQLLHQQLLTLGQGLLVRRGRAEQVIADVCREFAIHHIASHEETGTDWTYQRDLAVAAMCKHQQLHWQEYRQFAVFRPLTNRDDWFRQADAWLKSPLCPTPSALPFVLDTALSLRLLELPLQFHAKDPGLCKDAQQPQHMAAYLHSFWQQRARTYRGGISKAWSARRSCSRLSPYLAYGMLSLRQLQQQTYSARKHSQDPQLAASLSAFFSRLRWHCHFIQKLEDEVALEHQCMHPLYEGMRGVDHKRFTAWATGRTGYPFIDACMRSLITTGWLHFRGRAMLVAFACYHLWLDWRPVALHLARCFIDYEPGIHYPQVQMQAGTTGINPYRMYNPVLQSQQKDPDGRFIRQWVPELAEVPLAFLHTPWLLTQQMQQQFGISLPACYETPIVEMEQAAREARVQLKNWQQRHADHWQQHKQQVVTRHASRKRPRPTGPISIGGAAKNDAQLPLFDDEPASR